MRLRHIGKSVVDGMRRSQAAVFKTDAAQIYAGFDDGFQFRRDDVLFYSFQGFQRILEERLIAQFGQSQGRHGALAAGHGLCAAAVAGTGFKIRRQGVAHTGNEIMLRSLGNDSRIDEDDVGVAVHHEGLDDHAFIVINDSYAAAWRVVRRNRRNNDRRQSA